MNLNSLQERLGTFAEERSRQAESVDNIRSYDLHCTLGNEVLYVEVKGTTTTGESIILTANEVKLHEAKHPANALVVVSRIHLDCSATPPTASGGQLTVHQPWPLNGQVLEAKVFTYNLTAVGGKLATGHG